MPAQLRRYELDQFNLASGIPCAGPAEGIAMSQADCLDTMPRHHVNDTSLDPPFDFVAFLAQVRRLDCEAARLLLSNWLESYEVDPIVRTRSEAA